jgi:hypothetical protein
MKYVIKLNIKDLNQAQKDYPNPDALYNALVQKYLTSKGVVPNSADQITVVTHNLPSALEVIPDKPYK